MRTPRRSRAIAAGTLAAAALLAACSTTAAGDTPAVEVAAPPGDTPVYAVTETGLRAGSADAPVEVVVYQDMQCPYCAALHLRLHHDFAEWAAGEDVQIEFRTMNKLAKGDSETFSSMAGNIATAVAEHDVDAWGSVQEALYAAQGGDVGLGGLVQIAREAGADLPQDAVEQIEDRAFDETLQAAYALSQAEEVPYVPYVLVDGQPVEGGDTDMVKTGGLVREAIEAALAVR